jgi:hypothetical protein
MPTDITVGTCPAPECSLSAEDIEQFAEERLREEGLSSLFDRPIPGWPVVTTQASVEKALIQVI